MGSSLTDAHIYDGEGDQLMEGIDQSDRLIILPDEAGSRQPDLKPRIRIMWGHWLLEDLLAAAVNDAVRRVEKVSQEKMGSLTTGLTIPGLNLPL